MGINSIFKYNGRANIVYSVRREGIASAQRGGGCGWGKMDIVTQVEVCRSNVRKQLAGQGLWKVQQGRETWLLT